MVAVSFYSFSSRTFSWLLKQIFSVQLGPSYQAWKVWVVQSISVCFISWVLIMTEYLWFLIDQESADQN